MKKLYLAGPMKGYEQSNFPAFFRHAKQLREQGYEVVNPAEIEVDQSDYGQCMREDIRQLIDCEGIALMPGWDKSKGASLEYAIADIIGLAVIRLDRTDTALDVQDSAANEKVTETTN